MYRNDQRALILYSPRTTFLSLPPEIRSQIYQLSLVSDRAIIPWAAGWQADCIYDWDDPCNDRMRLTTDPTPKPIYYKTLIRYLVEYRDRVTQSLQHLSIKLLICGNKQVAKEAAYEFYTNNVFRFDPGYDWIFIVEWLQNIGRIRRHLKYLEFVITMPDQVRQLSNGERQRENNAYLLATLHPRHHYFRAPSAGNDENEGFVDVIDPVIEQIFVLLSRAQEIQTRRTISLLLPMETVPGVIMDPQHVTCFGMDLPNLVEKFRLLYCGASVVVLWKGDASELQLIKKRGEIEALGWELMFAKTKQSLCIFTRSGEPSMPFILQRSDLKEPLVAQDPVLGPGEHSYIHFLRF